MSANENLNATASALELAGERGLDLAPYEGAGSGPDGRLWKSDVEQILEDGGPVVEFGPECFPLTTGEGADFIEKLWFTDGWGVYYLMARGRGNYRLCHWGSLDAWRAQHVQVIQATEPSEPDAEGQDESGQAEHPDSDESGQPELQESAPEPSGAAVEVDGEAIPVDADGEGEYDLDEEESDGVTEELEADDGGDFYIDDEGEAEADEPGPSDL